MTLDLFADQVPDLEDEFLDPGAVVLRGFAAPRAAVLADALAQVTASAPFRHLVTPGGFRMSVAMTNCGELGWVSDRRGYRYDRGRSRFRPAVAAAARRISRAGAHVRRACRLRGLRPGRVPDQSLCARRETLLHQDRDELDLAAPIVSVSLGLPAVFLWGGDERADKARRIPLYHGDVAVWGGPSRLRFHGILALKEGEHPFAGAHRINLTFRKVRA